MEIQVARARLATVSMISEKPDVGGSRQAETEEYLPAIMALQQSDLVDDRYQAIRWLYDVIPKQQCVVDAIVRSLNDECYHIRSVAMGALLRTPLGPDVLMRHYLERMDDAFPLIRAIACRYLHACAERYVECGALATRRLVAALRDEHYFVRRLALRMLTRDGYERWMIPHVIALLQDEDQTTQEMSIEAAGVLEVTECAPLLLPMLDDPNDWIRSSACWALGRIARAALETVQVALPAIARVRDKDASVQVRVAAGVALEDVHQASIVSPTAGRTTAVLLALVNTCLEWEEGAISERLIQRSTIFRDEREKLELDPEVNTNTIHYQLESLAQMCKVERLFETDAKRQRSHLRADVINSLRLIQVELQNALRRAAEITS